MTALQSDVDFLAHFGVKGMKWGVRNERRMEKKDAKWAQKQKNYKTIIKVNNTAAVRANADVQDINARYSGVDLTKPSAKTTKYYKEVEKNWNDHVARAASELGVSPSGRRKMSVKIDMYTKDFVMDDVDVTHSDLQKMLIIRDESGAVIEFKLEEPLEHSNALSEDLDFLAHFGVKGMKWGVRKEARVRNRQLNKASRKKDKSEHADEVQAARDHVNSGQSKANLKQAKKDYKADKVRVGSREARKILAEKRDAEYEIIAKSQEAKNGKEVATRVLLEVGLSVIENSAARR